VLIDSQYVKNRPKIMSRLAERGIGTSVYYPQPVPRMTYYQKKYGYEPRYYKNAELISDSIIALTVAPHVTQDQIVYMAEQFMDVIGGIND